MKSTEELMALRNAGRKTIEEIDSKLKRLGIKRMCEESTPVTETIQDIIIADSEGASNSGDIELEKLRAMRDSLAEEVEKLRQQTKSAEQLLASYDAILNGTTQDNSQKTEAKGE